MNILSKYPQFYFYSAISYHLFYAFNLLVKWQMEGINSATQQAHVTLTALYAQGNIAIWILIAFTLSPYFVDKLILSHQKGKILFISKKGKYPLSRKEHYRLFIPFMTFCILIFFLTGFIYIPSVSDIQYAYTHIELVLGGAYTGILTFFLINLLLIITEPAKTILFLTLRIVKLLKSVYMGAFIIVILIFGFFLVTIMLGYKPAYKLELTLLIAIVINLILAYNEFCVSKAIAQQKDKIVKDLEQFFS